MLEFHIRVAGDDLSFAAGHFISFDNGSCERLHGHGYRVAVEVFGPLDESRCVVDFLVVRRELKTILADLDHRVLLPTRNSEIRIVSQAGEVEVKFGDRRWVFPKDNCLLLAIANTTTESLAQYIGQSLAAALNSHGLTSYGRLRIEVGEGSGCSAVCEM